MSARYSWPYGLACGLALHFTGFCHPPLVMPSGPEVLEKETGVLLAVMCNILVCYETVDTSCGHAMSCPVPAHLCACLYSSLENPSHYEIGETLGSESWGSEAWLFWVLNSFVVHLSLKKKRGPVDATLFSTGSCIYDSPGNFHVLQSPVSLSSTGFWSLVCESSFPLPIDGKGFAASSSSLMVLFVSVVWLIWCLFWPKDIVFLFFLTGTGISKWGIWMDMHRPLTSLLITPNYCLLPEPSLTVPLLNLSRTSQSSLEIHPCGLPDPWLSLPHFPVLTLSLGLATLMEFPGRMALNIGLRCRWERRTFSFCCIGFMTWLLNMFASLKFFFVCRLKRVVCLGLMCDYLVPEFKLRASCMLSICSAIALYPSPY